MPKTLIEFAGVGKSAEVRYLGFQNSTWEPVPEISEHQSAFSQRILIVPDELAFFRLRRFPVDAVSKQALREAVELDLVRWSPWQENFDFYYWPQRNGEHWSVAVWVWEKAGLSLLVDDKDINPTHVVPESAWNLATLNTDKKAFIYIRELAENKWSYASLGEGFSTLQIVDVTDSAGAQRFWNGLAAQEKDLPVLVGEATDMQAWLALEGKSEAGSDVEVVSHSEANSQMLSTARQQGISDWSDPFVWAKPVAAVLCLYIFWLICSGLVLLKHGRDVAGYIAETGSSSMEVLDKRENVERISAILDNTQEIRRQQVAFESLVSALSVALPKNAWLEHMEYSSSDGGWIDITGKSQESAGLAAILEEMPEVEQASFLNDIRKDARTGLEPFKIRLKLAQSGI